MRTRSSTSLTQNVQRTRRDPVRFFRETYAELHKVTWPSRQEAVRLTVMVLVVSAAVGLLLFAIDYFFTILVSRLVVPL